MASTTEPGSPEQKTGITRGQWMTLLAAFLGWMFDGFEIGLFPLVARPALLGLLGESHKDQLGLWNGIMTAAFLLGAATGGVVFGWLGDRIGRVRAMTLSVLAYALFMGLGGFAGSVHMLFLCRFLAALGMGGEWSLGVALVMEIWPNRSRGVLAGLIGGAANVGFLLIALAGLVLGKVITSAGNWMNSVGLPESWVNYLLAEQGWRMLMIFGATPALLTFFIRLVVPESEKWLKEKKHGTTSNWATQDLLGVLLGSSGPMLIVYLAATQQELSIQAVGWVIGLIVALVGYTYPVVRYLQRGESANQDAEHRLGPTLRRMLLAACVSGVALLGTWASMQWATPWADQLAEKTATAQGLEKTASDAMRSEARSYTQIISGIGAIIGTMAGALLGNAIGRRPTFCVLCGSSLISALAFFNLNNAVDTKFFVLVFLAGATTASFYGWLPLYLPELFRTSIRATGQGFSFNFGRILAAVGALQTGNLMKFFEQRVGGGFPEACSVMSLIYLVGMIIIWFVPETRGKPLPD